jgi:hypothetical protein
MTEEQKQPSQQPQQQPPAFGPYFISSALLALGLWCVYDGWFTTDPEMFRHMNMNRVAAMILLPFAIYDLIHTRKFEKKRKAKQAQKNAAKDDFKS